MKVRERERERYKVREKELKRINVRGGVKERLHRLIEEERVDM